MYPDGVRNRLSEAPIGGEAKNTVDGSALEGRSFYGRGFRGRGDPPKQLFRTGRIINGVASDYGEWPWQVSLRQWRTGDRIYCYYCLELWRQFSSLSFFAATYLHKCGCALLSENWAITAAHCVEK